MRGQGQILFQKGTKGNAVLGGARSAARRQEGGATNSAHHFTRFFRVRDVVNAFRPDSEVSGAIFKRIVKRRMHVPF
jgi:hypothetical protein